MDFTTSFNQSSVISQQSTVTLLMTDISSYRWVGANFKPHLKMNDNQQTQLTISNLDQQTRKELRQHFRQQPPQPKRQSDLIPDLKRNLTHGWLLPYLGQIDNLLWGRWQYWARCQVVPQSASCPNWQTIDHI